MHTDKLNYSMAPIAREDWIRIFGRTIQHSPLANAKKSTSSRRTPMQDVPSQGKSNGCKCGRSR
jgi:hypothetical protein